MTYMSVEIIGQLIVEDFQMLECGKTMQAFYSS